jgi:hypothetical protein
MSRIISWLIGLSEHGNCIVFSIVLVGDFFFVDADGGQCWIEVESFSLLMPMEGNAG